MSAVNLRLVRGLGSWFRCVCGPARVLFVVVGGGGGFGCVFVVSWFWFLVCSLVFRFWACFRCCVSCFVLVCVFCFFGFGRVIGVCFVFSDVLVSVV